MLILFSQLMFAEESAPTILFDGGRNAILATRDTFSIEVLDGVKDGCLPTPNKLKDKMEYSLRKNGFTIISDSKNNFSPNQIDIDVVGYKISNNSCVVHISAKLYMLSSVSVPYTKNETTFMSTTHILGGILLSGSKYSMQKRLEDEVTEFGDELYLDISRAKDEIFSKFPSIKKKYNESKKKQL